MWRYLTRKDKEWPGGGEGERMDEWIKPMCGLEL
jgi:hypothetical protein